LVAAVVVLLLLPSATTTLPFSETLALSAEKKKAD